MERIGDMGELFKFFLVEKKKRTIALWICFLSANGRMKKRPRTFMNQFCKIEKNQSPGQTFRPKHAVTAPICIIVVCDAFSKPLVANLLENDLPESPLPTRGDLLAYLGSKCEQEISSLSSSLSLTNFETFNEP
jgi:hypothetical protein